MRNRRNQPYSNANSALGFEAEKYTGTMRTLFDEICDKKGIHQGIGPAGACFETIGNSEKSGKQYVYGSFTCRAREFKSLIELAKSTFEASLIPNLPLIWREWPELGVDFSSNELIAYWRCIQYDQDVPYLDIRWPLRPIVSALLARAS